MRLKKCILFFISIFYFFGNLVSFANSDIFQSLEVSYFNFIDKIETKYNEENEIKLLSTITPQIESLLSNKNISDNKKKLLEYFKQINQDKIEELKAFINKKNKLYNTQKTEELKYILRLKQITKIGEIPPFIKDLQDSWKTLISVDENFEFVENNIIKQFFLEKNTNYYNISASTYKSFYNMQWIIVYNISQDKYMFFLDNWSYKIITKTPFSNFYKNSINIIDTKNNFSIDEKGMSYIIKKEWNNYYLIQFERYFDPNNYYWYYPYSLEKLWHKNIIFFKDFEGKIFYITEFKKTKFIWINLISSVKDKENFIKIIHNDKAFFYEDGEKFFYEIKQLSKSLTKNMKTDDEKIQKIYSWIIDNISYLKDYDLKNKDTFSWIITYKNKTWVCEWYVNLMIYMLLFSGIKDIEDIDGWVTNSKDFLKIWHSWLRIENYYYDPTFDDPIIIWQKQENLNLIKEKKYKYFKLPKDLMYADRYDYEYLAENIKTLSLEERNDIVKKNFYNLALKYKDNNYELLKAYYFRIKYNLKYNEKITKDILKNVVIPYYEVYNNNWSILINERLRYIHQLEYIKFEKNDDLEPMLEAKNFNIDWIYILKWNFWDNQYEYRLWYNLKIRD